MLQFMTSIKTPAAQAAATVDFSAAVIVASRIPTDWCGQTEEL